METIQTLVGGKELTFKVEFEHDSDAGTPWENSDCHGPVSDWTSRDKRPGELVLNSDSRGRKRFYDFQEACRIGRLDQWDAAPYSDDETPRQRAAKAARADFEYLRQWCNDEWSYVGVTVTVLDDEGNETPITDSLWGVETSNDYHHEAAKEMADELAHGFGVRWCEVTKPSYDWISEKAA